MTPNGVCRSGGGSRRAGQGLGPRRVESQAAHTRSALLSSRKSIAPEPSGSKDAKRRAMSVSAALRPSRCIACTQVRKYRQCCEVAHAWL